jgi:hypothetical protein
MNSVVERTLAMLLRLLERTKWKHLIKTLHGLVQSIR